MHVTSAIQDEQTGPRGPTYVYDKLSNGISNGLVLVNGVHGTYTNADLFKDRMAWLDYWMLNKSSADLGMQSGSQTLSNLFGTQDHTDQELARGPGLPGPQQGGR